MDKLAKLYEKGLSRRNFLAGAGALGAGVALAGCDNSTPATTTIAPTTTAAPTTTTAPATTTAAPATFTDVDILNFALNLEYLEAEFYLRAATGSGLTAADIGANPGAVTVGNAGVVQGTTSAQSQIINEIAYEEQEHVRFLRKALGTAAIDRPAIDLSFFGMLATAAGIANGASFSPFANFDAFLIGSFIFEDVGVTAYAGAAPLITTPAYLTAAGGIMAVEAYHAGYVRTSITGRGITNSSATYVNIANQVVALRTALGGSGFETMLTLPTSLTTPSSIVAASTTAAIGFARTTSQVLHIVYGSATAGTAKGGFFPNGITSKFFATAN